MIKKVIFDLDDTLIMWKNEYYNSLDDALKYFNIKYDNEIKEKLKLAVKDYEIYYNTYKKEYMKEIMEKYINDSLPENFIDIWIFYLKSCVPTEPNEEFISTLEYLHKKYELVVLTNWFTEQQKERLKNYKIESYFKNVIGTDYILNKPNKEAFIHACIPYSSNECVMIGDSLSKDINGAINAGMDAILFDFKNEYKGKLKKITKIEELKDIL